MKSKLSLVLFLLAVLLVAHLVAEDSAKPREKRSPNPQLGRLFGRFLGNLIKSAKKQVPLVIKLIRKDPVKAGAAAAGAAVVGVGVGIGVSGQNGKKTCQVHIRRDLPDRQPVFIRDGSPRSLMVPKDGYLTWTQGETSTIACPPAAGSENAISATNNIVDTIKCDNGLMFELNRATVNISTIVCNQRVTGNFQVKTDPQCAGTNKAIGFNVGNEFFDLYYSCFDDTNAFTYYTHHVLFGNEISHKCIPSSSRPDFKSTGFTNRFQVRSAYVEVKQNARLAELFTALTGNNVTGYSEAQRFYSQSYLQKGHLTPDADELFTTWQWATYFYINVAGMWDLINNGNWKHVETKVRKLASDTGETLEIYTGTYGTLELCTSSNNCTPFTLVDGGIPVPRWLWKIVKSTRLDAAIALVVSNDPFKSVATICGSMQNNDGWFQDGFDNFHRGEVSYCTVEELKKVVPYIPTAATATNVLAFY